MKSVHSLVKACKKPAVIKVKKTTKKQILKINNIVCPNIELCPYEKLRNKLYYALLYFLNMQ